MSDDIFRAGDANRITRAYFDSLLIEMRHLGASLPSTEVAIYGEPFKTPIMTAALSHLDNQRPGARWIWRWAPRPQARFSGRAWGTRGSLRP